MGMYDNASKRVSNSKFVEFEAGKQVRLRLLDHPHVSTKQFQEGGDIKTQFAWPVWNYDLDKQQILQKGSGIFKRIGAIVSAWGEDMPMKCDLMITSTGSGLTTKYDITPVPHAGTMPLIPKAEKLDLSVELTGSIPLSEFSDGKDPAVQGPESTKSPTLAALEAGDTVPTDIPDGDINLDDIPF